MNMKKLMTTVVAAISMATFAKGIYFVSGGDFRTPVLKYSIYSEYPNQPMEVTPNEIRTLGVYNSNSWAVGPWEVKVGGNVYTYEDTNTIRQAEVDGLVGDRGVNVLPLTNTFETVGKHIVRIYDSGNFYSIRFVNRHDIGELVLNWADLTTNSGIKSDSFIFQINNCTNLQYIKIDNPTTRQMRVPNITNVPNLRNLTITHPEMYVDAPAGSFLAGSKYLTNDMVFVSMTNMAINSFKFLNNVQYAAFPNIEIIGQQAFNDSLAAGERHVGPCLSRFGIGEKLRVLGVNALYNHPRLTTIEFTPNDPNGDWVAAWNNHPILPVWLGPAHKEPTDGENEATLTPNTEKTQYYTGSLFPKPTRLVKVVY